MRRLYLCKDCKKPKSKKINGRAMKGKKLIKAAQDEKLGLEVRPCKCLGKCKKGPNGVLMPGKERLHRLSIEELRKLDRAT